MLAEVVWLAGRAAGRVAGRLAVWLAAGWLCGWSGWLGGWVCLLLLLLLVLVLPACACRVDQRMTWWLSNRTAEQQHRAASPRCSPPPPPLARAALRQRMRTSDPEYGRWCAAVLQRGVRTGQALGGSTLGYGAGQALLLHSATLIP